MGVRADYQDIVGVKFGTLTVLEYIKELKPKNRVPYHIYKVKCECGQLEVVRRTALQSTKKQCIKCCKRRRRDNTMRMMFYSKASRTLIPNLAVRSCTK